MGAEERAERRAARKGKAREPSSPVNTKSQDAREKVLDWKIRLCTTNSSTNVRPTNVVSARTPLGFPVVKRTSVTHKEVKNKTPNSFTPIENAVRTEAPISNSQSHDFGEGPKPIQNAAADNATDGIIAVVDSKASVPTFEGLPSCPDVAEVSFETELGPDKEVGPSDIVRKYFVSSLSLDLLIYHIFRGFLSISLMILLRRPRNL